MSTPDGMPTLSKGAHSPGDGQACVMEYVALLAGEEWSDRPSCTHPVLAEMARCVNDRLPDSERHRLVPLIGRLFGTGEGDFDHEAHVLRVRLAAWCAREVLDLVRPEDREVAERAVMAAEGWCDGLVTANAAYAAKAANAAHTYAAAYAAQAANAAHTYAANAYAYADRMVGLLTGLIDEYDRLTGRVEHRIVIGDDLATLTAAV